MEREALERNTCFTSRNETNKQKQNREILKFVTLDGRINQFLVAPILTCGSEKKKLNDRDSIKPLQVTRTPDKTPLKDC